MVCEHLAALEAALIEARMRETYRGQAWSMNCREWVYFSCVLDRDLIRGRMSLDGCVKDHEHYGTHDGQEAGFACEVCKDGVMGIHPRSLDAGKYPHWPT